MRKLLWIIVLLVVIAGAASLILPNYAGKRVQAAFDQAAEELSENPDVSATIEEYERGWFTSKAKSVLTFETKAGETFSFRLASTVRHGLTPFRPWYAKIETTPELEAGPTERLKPYLKGRPIVRLTTTIFPTGVQRYAFQIPPISSKQGAEVAFDWKGLEAVVELSGDEIKPDSYFKALLETVEQPLDLWKKPLHGKIEVDSLYIEDEETELRISGAEMDYEYEFWEGSSALRVDGVHVGIKEGGINVPTYLFLGRAAMEQHSSDDEDSVDYEVVVKADTLQVGVKKYTGFILQMEMMKVSKQAFVNYLEIVTSLQKRLAAGDLQGQDVVNEFLTARFSEQFWGVLLGAGPEFRISKFGFSSPEGEIQANLKVQYVGDRILTDFRPKNDLAGDAELSVGCDLAENMVAFGLKERIRMESRRRGRTLPEQELARLGRKSAAEVLRRLVSKGLIQRQGDECKMNAVLQSGILTINGRPAEQLVGSR